MAENKRYVVVDNKGKQVGGPYIWDGVSEWSPPEDGKLVLEEVYLRSLVDE
jgi:hypothetical protein